MSYASERTKNSIEIPEDFKLRQDSGTCLFIQTISVLSNLPDIFLLYLIPVKKTAVANKTSRQPSEQSA